MNEPDGYAVVQDDAASAPRGYWFAACYTTPKVAADLAAKIKGRMVPVYFAPPSSVPEATSAADILVMAKRLRTENVQKMIEYGTAYEAAAMLERLAAPELATKDEVLALARATKQLGRYADLVAFNGPERAAIQLAERILVKAESSRPQLEKGEPRG